MLFPFSLLLIFLPYIFSLYISNPFISYWFSWFSSLFLIFGTFTGIIIPIPQDRPLKQQLFRPIFFGQLLLIGYTGITTVFFFLDKSGYYFFEQVERFPDMTDIRSLAICQKYILLAHASYLAGLIIKADYSSKNSLSITVSVKRSSLLTASVLSFLFGFIFEFTPFSQIGIYLVLLGCFLAVYYLFKTIQEKKPFLFPAIYVVGLIVFSFTTGMKEGSLLLLLFILINLFHLYSYKSLILAIPILFIYFFYVPAITSQYRQMVWYGEQSTLEAFDNILSEENLKETDFKKDSWTFLTIRSSEVSMFISYTNYVPTERNYYGFEIMYHGFISLIPRFVWPDKPSPDETAIARAIESGAFARSEGETTSAKPQLIADAYLTYGSFSIIIVFFIVGFLSTQFSIIAERLFGGYELGTVIIYHSCFYILNRGNCFENMFNSIFYGFLLMFALQHVFLKYKLIAKK